MPANQYDPVRYSDYNALYSTIATLVGPLQTSAPNVYIKGTGYGLPLSSLASLAYPFNRTISSVSNTNPCQITTTANHNLVAGEQIYIDNISNVSWGATPLNGNYFVVNQIISPTVFSLVNVDSRVSNGYPSGWSGGTGAISQFVISANQFNNLRTDLNRAWKHVTGSDLANDTTNDWPLTGLTSGAPIPVRGDPILHNIYLPYYNRVNDVNTYKYIMQDAFYFGWNVAPVRDGATNAWGNGLMSVETIIDFPTNYDFVQYFNTGGFFNLNLVVTNTSNGPASAASQNTDWKNLATSLFGTGGINYGAYNKAGMGYTSSGVGPYGQTGAYGQSASAPWTSAGAYNATAATYGNLGYINQVTSTTANYTTNYIGIKHRAYTQKKIGILIDLYNGHVNQFSPNVTARFQLNLTLYYTVGSITLQSDPYVVPWTNTQISFSNGSGGSVFS